MLFLLTSHAASPATRKDNLHDSFVKYETPFSTISLQTLKKRNVNQLIVKTVDR